MCSKTSPDATHHCDVTAATKFTGGGEDRRRFPVLRPMVSLIELSGVFSSKSLSSRAPHYISVLRTIATGRLPVSGTSTPANDTGTRYMCQDQGDHET